MQNESDTEQKREQVVPHTEIHLRNWYNKGWVWWRVVGGTKVGLAQVRSVPPTALLVLHLLYYHLMPNLKGSSL